MTTISALMKESHVGFGTSGARGLATDMTDRICYAYTLGFLQYLQQQFSLKPCAVAIAGDFRPSTPRIMSAVAQAVIDSGFTPVNAGFVPTPAVALWAIAQNIPSIMVTGSHIPDDRNGIKFYRCDGEVLKSDEAGMQAQDVTLDDVLFDANGQLLHNTALPEVNPQIHQNYIKHYTDCFPADLLQGKRIGIYQHSSVARDLMMEIFTELGATTLALGYSDTFIPVDTEAIRQEDIILAQQWTTEHHLDAIVSTDGDGDRPLLSNESGEWLRGDIAGILVSQYLNIDALAVPVSCNTAVEKCGAFTHVSRTKIGSPYVIEEMNQLSDHYQRIAGYEANGGYLTHSDIALNQGTLTSLPTRDALLVPIAILALATQRQQSIEQLITDLPTRFTASDRIKNFPTELSQKKISEMITGGNDAIQRWLSGINKDIDNFDTTDGLRIVLTDQEVIHLRPSGNAPELRCYTESDSEENAIKLNRICLTLLSHWQ